jgi:beta-phosphoglucomutase-like phosphatase (HAD superfamily)
VNPNDDDASRGRTAFLFDLDGTLVDSVYQHVLAWREAMAGVGIELAVWTIHRRIGMSGGLMANAVLRETGHAGDRRRGRTPVTFAR